MFSFTLDFSNKKAIKMAKSILNSIFLRKSDFSKANNKLMHSNYEKLMNSVIRLKIDEDKSVDYKLKLTEEEMNNAFSQALEELENA